MFGHLPTSGSLLYESDAFLGTIIDGDNTRLHHCKLGSKRQSMEWKHPHNCPERKTLKNKPFTGKLILQFFGPHKAQYCKIFRRDA
jgi:hypothetical protein